MEKTVITNTAQGFTFLGASCKRVSKEINNDLNRMTGRMCMNVDLPKIYKKLVEGNFARFSNYSPRIPLGTANNSIINFSHADIVKLYNLKVRELINYYSFVSNSHILRGIIWQMHKSCALTLAKKYKLRSQSAIIQKFGNNLVCPKTGVKLLTYTSQIAINKFRPNVYSLNFGLSPHTKTYFSTKAASGIQITQLSSFFITGFTDAEGSFILKI